MLDDKRETLAGGLFSLISLYTLWNERLSHRMDLANIYC